jgi:nitroreductase/FMN reductase [NAD(P)H]
MTAISLLLHDRFGFEIPAHEDAGNETIRGILGRRTHRAYLDRDVPDALMDLLLACAQSAPTKSNLQQYAIVVVKNPELRRAVGGLVPYMPWLADAPAAVFFLGDVRRIRRLAEMRGHAYANNTADTFMNAAVDAALAMQCFITAAESAGLGCCPISYIRNRIDDFADLLALPDGVFPVAGLTVGWPDTEGHASMRLPPSVIVHRDRYDDSGLEQEVEAYDARAHASRAIAPDKQRHTDKYGVLDVCTWSENVTRQLSLLERPEFAAFLKRQGIELV